LKTTRAIICERNEGRPPRGRRPAASQQDHYETDSHNRNPPFHVSSFPGLKLYPATMAGRATKITKNPWLSVAVSQLVWLCGINHIFFFKIIFVKFLSIGKNTYFSYP
jgi:hypothetical protein